MTVEQHQRVGSIEVLTIPQGFVTGLVAAVVMGLVAMAGSALAGNGFWTWLNAVGSFWREGQVSTTFAGGETVLGAAIQLIVGGLLGALYASAQERVDDRSLLIIAVWYGFITWFVASFLILSWLSPSMSQIMRTWPLFVAHLVFGGVLGLTAVRRNRSLGPLPMATGD